VDLRYKLILNLPAPGFLFNFTLSENTEPKYDSI